jgi:hypothetical protein
VSKREYIGCHTICTIDRSDAAGEARNAEQTGT